MHSEEEAAPEPAPSSEKKKKKKKKKEREEEEAVRNHGVAFLMNWCSSICFAFPSESGGI